MTGWGKSASVLP